MAEPRSLPSDAVERLLAAANGDAALLYLHFAAGRPLENAREALRMSEARYDLACATLQQLGLWPQEPQRHLDASQAPVYTEQDVIRETHTSREFEAITGETQRRLGRVLSNEELKILLSIYRYLGLPGEVISILVNYCIQRQRSRGIARMPSLRSIEEGSVLLGRPRHRHHGAGGGLHAEPAPAPVAAGEDQGAVRHFRPQAHAGRGELYPDLALLGLRRKGDRPGL
ncbi:MAG: DnaD domain protein [Oscillospiraceae bacterium]